MIDEYDDDDDAGAVALPIPRPNLPVGRGHHPPGPFG